VACDLCKLCCVKVGFLLYVKFYNILHSRLNQATKLFFCNPCRIHILSYSGSHVIHIFQFIKFSVFSLFIFLTLTNC
jgi:hypothetical protein